MNKFQHYSIKTKRGVESWSAIDSIRLQNGMTCYLMEHDIFGDEVNYIIMNSKGEVLEWDWCDSLLDWRG